LRDLEAQVTAAALDSGSALAGQVISDLLVMRMIKATAPVPVPALARVSPIPFSCTRDGRPGNDRRCPRADIAHVALRTAANVTGADNPYASLSDWNEQECERLSPWTSASSALEASRPEGKD
jgi:hypothetical protein